MSSYNFNHDESVVNSVDIKELGLDQFKSDAFSRSFYGPANTSNDLLGEQVHNLEAKIKYRDSRQPFYLTYAAYIIGSGIILVVLTKTGALAIIFIYSYKFFKWLVDCKHASNTFKKYKAKTAINKNKNQKVETQQEFELANIHPANRVYQDLQVITPLRQSATVEIPLFPNLEQ